MAEMMWLMHKLYPLFRPLLFAADPEVAHQIAFRALDSAAAFGIAQLRIVIQEIIYWEQLLASGVVNA